MIIVMQPDATFSIRQSPKAEKSTLVPQQGSNGTKWYYYLNVAKNEK